MAIEGNELPKGVSNSAKMGATPGTQQTAINNVGGPKLNFEMPAGPQLAKQANSSFQSSITPQMPIPMGGAPAKPGSAYTGNLGRRPTDAPVITNGLPMDNGRGYNVFAGMDAMQIGQMNSDMGLSNMTSLPQFKPEANQFSAGGGLETGSYAVTEEEGNEIAAQLGNSYNAAAQLVNPSSYAVQQIKEKDKAEEAAKLEEEKEAAADEAAWAEEYGDKTTAENMLYENKKSMEDNPAGFSEEQMAETEAKLDEKYARELQFALSGIDRQMAMMGTFGSGAHSFSINNATAQALSAMAGEYADLEKANALQYEKESQENILNNFTLSDKLLNLESLDGNEIKEILEMDTVISEKYESPLTAFIANEIKDFAPNGYAVWYGFLNDAKGDLYEQFSNGKITGDEYAKEMERRTSLLYAAMTSYVAPNSNATMQAQIDLNTFFKYLGTGQTFTIEY